MGYNNLTNEGEDMSGLLKLMEVLPQTKIENLGCVTAPKCLLSCQRPLTEKQTPFVHTGSTATSSAQKEERRSQRS